MEQQEIIIRLSVLEQQMKQMQEQLQAIEQGILDLDNLQTGLDELKNSKETPILAPIGRGIFAKAKIISDELVVNIGEGNCVSKNIPETKEIIKKQIEKLSGFRTELILDLEKLGEEMTKIIQEAEKMDMIKHEDECSCKGDHEKNHECKCSDDCKCKKKN